MHVSDKSMETPNVSSKCSKLSPTYYIDFGHRSLTPPGSESNTHTHTAHINNNNLFPLARPTVQVYLKRYTNAQLDATENGCPPPVDRRVQPPQSLKGRAAPVRFFKPRLLPITPPLEPGPSGGDGTTKQVAHQSGRIANRLSANTIGKQFQLPRGGSRPQF